MTTHLQDLAVMTGVSLLFLLLSWSSARAISRGRPLSHAQRSIVFFAFVFVLGMSYSMMIGSWLGWPDWGWSLPTAVWGGLLAFIAWRRHNRSQAVPPRASSAPQRRSNLRQGFAVVALLITLIIATIEWDFVWENQGHLLAALLWSVGVAGSILLAYGNRRTTVIVALRVYLVLMVIGVVAERQTAALVFLAIAAAVYFGLEKLWKKPQPPVLDLEALSGDPRAGTEDSHVETKQH